MTSPNLIIGIGHPYRGDDKAGLEVASRLKSLAPPGWEFCFSDGDGAAMMESWKERSTVIVIDATDSGGSPGTVIRIEADSPVIRRTPFGGSSHLLSLVEAIDLSRALGCLPERLIIYGIEVGDTSTGVELSPSVAAASVEVVAKIMAELNDIRQGKCQEPKSAAAD